MNRNIFINIFCIIMILFITIIGVGALDDKTIGYKIEEQNNLIVTWNHTIDEPDTQQFILEFKQTENVVSQRSLNDIFLILSDTYFNASDITKDNFDIKYMQYSTNYEYVYKYCTDYTYTDCLCGEQDATHTINGGWCQKLIVTESEVQMPISDSMFKYQESNGTYIKIEINDLLLPVNDGDIIDGRKYIITLTDLPYRTVAGKDVTSGTFSLLIDDYEYWDKTHSSYWTSEILEYETPDGFNITAEVYKDEDGTGNYTRDLSDTILMKGWTNGHWEFGYNDTGENGTELNNYYYEIKAPRPIMYDSSREMYGFDYLDRWYPLHVYGQDSTGRNRTCEWDYANCSFNVTIEYINETRSYVNKSDEIVYYNESVRYDVLRIYHNSYGFDDPSYTIEFVNSSSFSFSNETEFYHDDFLGLSVNESSSPYDNLVGYWNFDNDFYKQGQVGKSVYFDGDDYVDLDSNNFYDSYEGTFITWIKTDNSNNYPTIISTSNIFSTSYYLCMGLDESTGAIRLIQKNSDTQDTVYGNTDVRDNKWHQLVVSSNGTRYTLYVDGQLESINIGSGNNSGDWLLDTASRNIFLIGNLKLTSHNYYFDGNIDNVQIFNRSLSAEEINQSYQIGLKGLSNTNTDGLVGEWTFDNTLSDSSGNSNNGTWKGTYVGGAYDLSSNDNDGIYNGNAYVQNDSGVYNNYANFDVDGSYIDTNFNAITEGTISLWAKDTGSINSRVLFGIQNPTGDDRIYIGRTTAGNYGLGFGTINQNGNDVGSSMDSNWHHYLLKYNVTDAELYVDTVLEIEINNNDVSSVTGDFFIGGANYLGSLYLPGNFKGQVDEVMIFDRELNSSEISDIYNNQSSRFKQSGTITLPKINLNTNEGYFNKINVTIPYKEEPKDSNIELCSYEWNINDGYNETMEGLVGYWHFDGDATDVSGNGNDGTIVGGVTNTTGVYDGGFDFDGNFSTGGYIDIRSIDMTLWTEMTFVVWVKQGVDDQRLIFTSKYDSSNDIRIGMNGNGSSIFANFDDGVNDGVSGGTYNNGEWYHIVITQSNIDNELKLYVDGSLIDYDNCNFIYSGLDNLHSIGYRNINNNRYWNGSIDEVMIFNRSLSADEVKELYVKGRAKFQNGSCANSTTQVYEIDKSLDTTNMYFDVNMEADSYAFTSPTMLMSDFTLDDIDLWYEPYLDPNSDYYMVNTRYEPNDEFSHLSIDNVSNDVYDNLVGYWSFDGDFYKEGQVGQSIYFDGNDYVEIPFSDFAYLSEGSISGWFKTSNTGELSTLFSVSDSGDSSSEFVIRIPDGVDQNKLRIVARENGIIFIDFTADILYNDGAWHNFVYKNDFSGNHLYVDEELANVTYAVGDSSTSAFFSNVSDIDFAGIGANKDNGGLQWYFNGNIDNIQIYNHSLSSEEISQSYQRGLQRLQNNITDGLVGEWDFESTLDDTSGNGNNGVWGGTYTGKANDLSFNDNDGTFNGNAYVDNSSGIYDNYATFDGASDYISFSDFLNYDFSTDNFTISTWFNLYDNTSSNFIISQRVDDNNRWHIVRYSTGIIQIYFKNGGTPLASYTVSWNTSENIWHNLICKREGSVFKMYIDNEELSLTEVTALGSNDLSSYNANLVVGSMLGDLSADFNGSIDEIMIFNKSLTAEEISDIYNNQSIRFREDGTITHPQYILNETEKNSNNITITPYMFKSIQDSEYGLCSYSWDISEGYDLNTSVDDTLLEGLVGYWHLDGNATDSSGNGNDGTIVGDVTNSTGVYDGAYEFDGNYLSLGSNFKSVTESETKTISVWAKSNENNYTQRGRLITLYKSGGDSSYFTMFAETTGVWGGLYTTTTSYEIFETSANIDLEWHHHLMLQNGSNIYYYYDGVIVYENNNADNVSTSLSEDAEIGAFNYGDHPFNGSIDEVMIFNRSLSSTEIKELYNKGRVNWQLEDCGNMTQGQHNVTLTKSNTSSNMLIEEVMFGNFYTPYSWNDYDISFNIFTNTTTTIEFIEPTLENGSYPQTYLPINVSVSTTEEIENISINVYNLDGLYEEQNSTNSPFYYNFTLLPNGIYYVNSTVIVNGISNTTETRDYTLDTTSPVFVGLSNQTINNPSSWTYTIYAEDNLTGISYYDFNWSDTFLINPTTGEITNSETLEKRMYYFNVSATNGVGLTTYTTFSLNVTRDPLPVGNNTPIQVWRNNESHDVCYVTRLGEMRCENLTILTGTDLYGTTTIHSSSLNIQEYLTFKYSDKIDNLVEGWLRVTNNLNVTNNLSVGGNMTVEGVSLINLVYGEMSYHNYTGTSLNFVNVNTYYPLFFTDDGHNNGMISELGFGTKSNLTVEYNGTYKIDLGADGSGQNNHEYHLVLFKNEIEIEECEVVHKMSAGGDINPMATSCIISLEEGDKLTVRIADYTSTGAGMYYGGHLNAIRIGN